MSWDVLLLRLPGDAASMEELPDGWAPPPLGRRQEVLAAVREAAPEADLSDPSWGELLGAGWSMELGMGSEDPVDTVMLHIRGRGDGVLPHVLRLADALGCKALDLSTGSFLAAGDTAGWHAFQAYRDRVVG
ncbi:hypothetical protein ACLGIH_18190 [Streptomyces sp. HMX87]|uniref:hypothetical protein n=1 Tax=Streptomyces sp. HMX87 TaxID=3390849 RepID=UPI003A83DB58